MSVNSAELMLLTVPSFNCRQQGGKITNWAAILI